MVDTAVQVFWEDISEEEHEEQERQEESKEEEAGGEDEDQGGVRLHVDCPQSLYYSIGYLHVQRRCSSHTSSKHWQGLYGGEGGGLGGKGVGLEEHHWADVGVGLHVHAAVVVVVEGEGLW